MPRRGLSIQLRIDSPFLLCLKLLLLNRTILMEEDELPFCDACLAEKYYIQVK